MTNLHPTLVHADDAARQMGCTRRTLQNWVAAGRFPKPLKLGRRSFYQQGQIDEYLARLTATTRE